MNVFITGSSTILGSAIVEQFFARRATIIACNRIPERSEHTLSFLEETIKDRDIDLVLLLHPLLPLFHQSERERDRLVHFSQNCCNFFSQRQKKPDVLFTASSVSVYDRSASGALTELSADGKGTQHAEYFKKSENTALTASQAGIRVVHLRTGQILSNRIPPPIKKISFLNLIPYSRYPKDKVINWVSQEDAVRAVRYLLAEKSISGPVNIVSGDTPTEAAYLKEVTGHYNLGTPIVLPRHLFTLFLGKKYVDLHPPQGKAFPMILMEKGFIFEDISLNEYLQKK